MTEAYDNPDENERYITQNQAEILFGNEDTDKNIVERCLQGLEPDAREILDVAFKLELSEITYINAKAYQQAKQIKLAEYKC